MGDFVEIVDLPSPEIKILGSVVEVTKVGNKGIDERGFSGVIEAENGNDDFLGQNSLNVRRYV
jgi:hypothetical protein